MGKIGEAPNVRSQKAVSTRRSTYGPYRMLSRSSEPENAKTESREARLSPVLDQHEFTWNAHPFGGRAASCHHSKQANIGFTTQARVERDDLAKLSLRSKSSLRCCSLTNATVQEGCCRRDPKNVPALLLIFVLKSLRCDKQLVVYATREFSRSWLDDDAFPDWPLDPGLADFERKVDSPICWKR